MIEKRGQFLAGFGITKLSDPLEVISAVEYAPQLDRLRHYGHLFGYPDHAVDFFVTAARSQEETGQFVKREFIRMPTYRASDERSPFVYAVPVGHTEQEADRRELLRALLSPQLPELLLPLPGHPVEPPQPNDLKVHSSKAQVPPQRL